MAVDFSKGPIRGRGILIPASTDPSDIRPADLPAGVTQTILASDPKRKGNCLAACVATFLGVELQQVPHFIEFGIAWNGEDDRAAWIAMLCGFMAGHGRWLVELDSLAEADGDEVVFVAGPSPRGVMHQVLYRDGVLWHDPHPSRDGVLEVRHVEAWRPLPALGFDHAPTDPTSTEGA